MIEFSNISLPSREMPWKQYYAKGYEDILAQEFLKETLWKFLERGILKDQDRHDALVYFGRRVSRRAFVQQVHLWGRVLKGMGVKEGDEILIFGPGVPEFIYIMLAADMVGALTNLPNLMTPPEGLESMVGNSRIAFVFDGLEKQMSQVLSRKQFETVVVVSATHSMGYPLKAIAAPWNNFKYYKERHRAKYLTADAAIRRFGNYSGPLEAPAVAGKTSYIFCSSGSSKKGVANQIGMSDSAMIAMFQNALAFNLTGNPFCEGTSSYCPLPPFVCTGYFVLVLAPLLRGMTVYLDPRISGKQFIRNVMSIRPQVTLIPGPIWVQFFEHVDDLIRKGKRPDLSFFRFPVMGGEGCTPEALRHMNELMQSCGSPVAVTSGYGLSETFSVCTVDYQPGVYDKDYSKRTISVGYAFPGTEVGIFDENGKELGFGKRGEVRVKTAAMTTGYIYDPELNAEKLKDGWLHTGDYGEIDRSGMLFVYGRMAQHILAPDGSTVYLFDISNELRQDEAVKNALVCLLEVKDGPAPLVAHIVLEDNVQEPEEQILLRLDKRMKKFLPEGLSIQGYRLEHGQLKSILVGKTDRHYYATLFSGYRIPRDGGIKEISFD